jgi:type IV secretory pathway TrbF-like protein
MTHDTVTIESEHALVREPVLRVDTRPTLPFTPEERWAQWKEKGAHQDARSGRIMRLIGLFVALALVIGFIWASTPR